jgi:hypothetical protein
MVGFVLPKLRWLVIGAVAAGGWAVTQEPVNKQQRNTERPVATQNVEKQSQRPRKQPQQVVQTTRSADRPQAMLPEPRPSKLVTSSIQRPEKPAAQPFYTASRVRLREGVGTATRMITWLEAGEKVTVLEHSGKWRRVIVAGRKGWIHGDYLRLPDPDAPRPPALVAKSTPVEVKKPDLTTSSKPLPAPNNPLAGLLQSKRPARAAQRGDCQCPYDLMINGKQCGDRSAYVMRGQANGQCYL